MNPRRLLVRQVRFYLCVLIVAAIAHEKGQLGVDGTISLRQHNEITEEVRRSWED